MQSFWLFENSMKFLKRFVGIGIDKDTDIWLALRIRVINLMCMILIALIVVHMIIVYSSSAFLSFYMLFIAVILNVSVYLNYLGKVTASRLYFLTCSYLIIMSMAIVFGEDLNFHYYLVPGVGMALILFRDEIGLYKWVYVFLGIPIWAFLEWWFINYPPFYKIDESSVSYLKYFSDVAVFISNIAMFSIFTKQSDGLMKDMHVLNDELHILATRDPLTDLYNRRYIFQRLSQLLKTTDSPGGTVAFTMLDIDDYKSINDTWGHEAGDVVLKELAFVIKDKTREADIVGRMGGDELCIIFFSEPQERVITALERLRKNIEQLEIEYNGGLIPVTCSFGVAFNSPSNRKPLDLIKAADRALYLSKSKGKNAVSYIE